MHITIDTAADLDSIATLTDLLAGRGVALTAEQRPALQAERRELIASLPGRVRAAAPLGDGVREMTRWLRAQTIAA